MLAVTTHDNILRKIPSLSHVASLHLQAGMVAVRRHLEIRWMIQCPSRVGSLGLRTGMVALLSYDDALHLIHRRSHVPRLRFSAVKPRLLVR